MCNLYKMGASVDEVRRWIGPLAGPAVNLPDYPAIYPGGEAPIIRTGEGGRRLERVGWGVPPPGGKGRPVTNVRNLASPFWRPLLSRPERRCLVPVTAFCEWTGEAGAKRQVWFERSDAPVFAFAGLLRDTDEGPRMAFLTCEPNPLVGRGPSQGHARDAGRGGPRRVAGCRRGRASGAALPSRADASGGRLTL